jgi:hypothetical protein
MKNFILTQLLSSKKVWLGISSILIPMAATWLGVDEDAVSKIWYSLLSYVARTISSRFWKIKKIIDLD